MTNTSFPPITLPVGNSREKMLRLAASGYRPQPSLIDMCREDNIQRLERMLSREELFRFSYVPFSIAELVWDYADTVCKLAAINRTKNTLSLSRAIQSLRRDYQRIHSRHIDKENQQSEISNMYVYEECVEAITATLIINIKADIMSEYPDLDDNYTQMIIATYQCEILLKALLLYVKRQSAKVARKINRNIGHILPDPIYKLGDLILLFAGDHPLSPNFSSLHDQYVETFATQIALVGLDENALPHD